jgi:hypothetical protein
LVEPVTRIGAGPATVLIAWRIGIVSAATSSVSSGSGSTHGSSSDSNRYPTTYGCTAINAATIYTTTIYSTVVNASATNPNASSICEGVS